MDNRLEERREIREALRWRLCYHKYWPSPVLSLCPHSKFFGVKKLRQEIFLTRLAHFCCSRIKSGICEQGWARKDSLLTSTYIVENSDETIYGKRCFDFYRHKEEYLSEIRESGELLEKFLPDNGWFTDSVSPEPRYVPVVWIRLQVQSDAEISNRGFSLRISERHWPSVFQQKN
jgi:hypothetical protein